MKFTINWPLLLSIFDCSCWQTFIFLLKASDPNTVLTAITGGFEVTHDSNQGILVLTCDQQIYKIVVDFHQPELLTGIVVILGGMHFLMDFVGCVGMLMADSGLKDIMSTTFGYFDKMLESITYPQNTYCVYLLKNSSVQCLKRRMHV